MVLKARDGDIVNTDDGDIYASNHLGLEASRDIINKGSSIASDGSGIITAGRNIENITSSKRYGDEKNHITKIGKQSTIKVRGPLALLSGGDLINKGSSIESGDLQFAVGGNMINESIEDSQSMETVFSGGHFKKKSVVYKPAMITSTGTTKGFVAGDFALIGSRMSSTGDSEIKVGGNSMLISQVNSHMTDSHMEYTTSGYFSDNDHVQSHQSLTETLAGSTITAGGKNVLINKGDQILQGATFHGGKGTFLKGRKTSMLATALRNLKSDYEYDEGTIFNTTDSTGFDNTGHVHSSLSGGGEQIIDSDIIESDFTSKTEGSKSDKFFGSLFSDMLINKQNTPSEQQKPSWAKKLEASGKSIKWNPVTNSSKSWDEHSEVLNPQFSAVVSIAGALGTMYLGGFGMFGSAGATGGATATGATAATTASTVTNVSMLSTMGTTMGQAAITGIASRASVSMINNKFDLGKVMGDLTSKESIKGLGLNVLTAGLTAGIGHGIGLKELAPGMDMMQRTKIITQQALINGAVRTGLAGATGENIGQLWKEEALSGGLALTQSKIGDIGDKKELKTGSIGKVAMHSVTGAIYSAATGASPISGAIGGATSEIVAGIMESGSGLNGPPSDKPLTPEQAKINADKRIKLEGKIKATTKLLSATATLLAGGSAKDITTAANVGESAIQHNLMGHRNKKDDAKVEKLTDEEVEEQYKQLSENSGAVSWLFYSPYEIALEAEHHRRFGSGLDTSIETQLSNTLTLAPGGKFIGAVLEKTTGKSLGISGTITEPDLSGSRLNIPGKMKNAVTTTNKQKAGQSDLVSLYERGESTRIGISEIDRAKGTNKRVRDVLGGNSEGLSTQDFQLQLKAEKALDAHAKRKSLTKSRVRTVNNRKPINSEYAGKTYPIEKLPEDLRQKYPHGVPFNGSGYPDFSRYAIKKVKINVTGKRGVDDRSADKAAGFTVRPEGYTWHHHQDSNIMQLVPTKLHDAVRHTGGVAKLKNK